MKLELERQEFLKAWQTAEKTASTKTPMDSISSILIRADDSSNVTLEATDLKTSVKCKASGVNVIETGSAVVPVAVLGSLLKKIKADTVTLEVSPERGYLNAGRSKSRFAVFRVEDFPRIPESSGAELICEIMASDLAKLITEGSSSASNPQDFPKYLGTCLLRTDDSYIHSASTDGKRLSLSKFLCNVSKNEDLLLPSPALKDLAKMMNGDVNVKILADGSTVWFELDDVEFSIRRIEATFPNYGRILNKEVKTSLRISRDELASALERIDIIAKTTTAHIMAMLLFPDGDLKIMTRAPELGTASEILEAKIEGEYMQIGFNVGYFLDGLKALGPGEIFIEFSGPEGQTRMMRTESEDFLYMLMPARLTVQDTMPDDDSENFSAKYQAAREVEEYGDDEDDDYYEEESEQENDNNSED